MYTFWKLVEKSTITSGVIAVLMVASACYLVCAGTPVPDWFVLSFGTIVGFFFGGKVQKEANNGIKGV